MSGQDEKSKSVPISGPGGRGPSIAGGPGGDEVPVHGPSADDVPEEATAEEQEAVDLGSELSFPASDPPAYMGAGAITGPPMRDEEKPEEPVVSEGGDPHDSVTGGKPSDDPTRTG